MGFVAFKKSPGFGGFSRVFLAGECRKFRIVNAEKFRNEAYPISEDSNLVGGFSPFEKNMKVKLDHFPKVRGEH